jgi:hypothetical protein
MTMKLQATKRHRQTVSIVFMVAGLFWIIASSAVAQVDCVGANALKVSRVQGQVFDITGMAVHGAVVSLVKEGKSTAQFRTGASGQFQFNAAPGRYVLKAEAPVFQRSDVELIVGRSLSNLFHPGTLRVILGLGGLFCSRATTSNWEFQKMVRTNNRRLKETEETNATQK